MARTRTAINPRKAGAKLGAKSDAKKNAVHRKAKPQEETRNLRPGLSFPVVAIGASAGGLAAFTELLKALPPTSGMAFVLIQHLDPEHESALTALLAKATSMPVAEVSEGMAVEPNCVYVIPPNKDMTISKGVLRLAPRSAAGSGLRHPIDEFAVALAEEQGDAAIGVVLSGTGSDGTRGLKAIKAAGGVTFAQEPKTAQWPAMPSSAIAAGSIDFILSPKRIAAELARLGRHPYLAEAHEVPEGSDLDKICLLVRAASGVDFRLYKQATVRRRIARRMALAKITSLSKYGAYLKQQPDEAQALADDVFIHVTSFFRDAECFQALRKAVLAKLRLKRPPEDPIRIWIAGCSTGEEVYSIAMLLLEELGEHATRFKIQIFGTDIQERAIEHARAGIYSEAAVAGLSPVRLKRFFVKSDHGYQIQKSIRDLCVFAKHDLAKDPPFSRMDLISCRNVLIYMGPALQKRVLSVFQYALKPGGFLFLGNSESISSYSDAFTVEDQIHRIFLRKQSVPAFRNFQAADYARERQAAPPRIAPSSIAVDFRKEAEAALLEYYGPPALVVDPDLHIVHFQGDVSPYLGPATGQPSFHLLKMVRPEFVVDLRNAISKVWKNDVPAHKDRVAFRHEGLPAEVRLEVRPLKKRNGKKPDLLVVFQRMVPLSVPASARKGRGAKKGSADRAETLDRELASTRDQLRSLIAEHDTAQEKMKAANEEILSSNEELQSTNEELETAKEELQSSNEELVTLNEELQHRNADLSVLTQDLNNLLTGIDLPVLVLDADLRIRRFTPVAGTLLNLIPGDVGRPFDDIASHLNVSDWDKLFAEVTSKGRLIAREVRDRNGRQYSLRVRPHQTERNEIDGVLVVLFDIDVIKRALDDTEEARRIARVAQLDGESILNSLSAHVAVIARDGTILATNDAWDRFARENGEVRMAAVGRSANYLAVCRKAMAEGVPEAEAALEGIQNVLEGSGDTFQMEYPCHSATEHRWFQMNVAPLKGTLGGAVVTHLNITDRKRAANEIERNAALVRSLIESAPQSVIAVNTDEIIVLANGNTETMFGHKREELIGKPLAMLIPESLRARHAQHHEGYFANMQTRPTGIGMNLEARRKDGSVFPVEIGLSSVETAFGKLAVAFVSDITRRKQAEESLRASEERMRQAVESTGLGTFELDLHTRRRIWSDVTKRHFGLPLDAEVTEELVQNALFPEDRERVNASIAEAIRVPKEDPYVLEFRVKAADSGAERWLLARGRVLLDEPRTPQRIVGIVLDITPLKGLEEALRRHERDIETLLDNSPDVILRTDPQGRYLYVNAATTKAAGLSAEDFVGKMPREVGMPENLCELWERTNRKIVESGVPQAIEFSYPSPGKDSMWEERLIPEFGSDGKVESILTVGREITERRLLENAAKSRAEEVRALAARLLTAQEEERRRVSRELHDHICQQLASLAIDIGAYAARPATAFEERVEYLKILQARAIKASEEARHIAYELHPSMLDDLGLNASMRSLCKDFSNQHPDIRLDFSNGTLPAFVPLEIASCVYRVAQESLHNVSKHSKATHVSVTLGFEPGALVMTISDDGAGFDVREAQGRGGLGLVGVQERARLLHGEVTIATKPGGGTRLSLTLPLVEIGQ